MIDALSSANRKTTSPDNAIPRRPKSCGPDARYAGVKSGREPLQPERKPSTGTTVTIKRSITGESTKQAGAPPRAERRMQTARPWRLRSCAFYFCTRGCGCARASGVPRALIWAGANGVNPKRAGRSELRLRAPPRRHNNRGDCACHLREWGKPKRAGCLKNESEMDAAPISIVITGLVPVIHVLIATAEKSWMAGTSPAMTTVIEARCCHTLNVVPAKAGTHTP